MKRPLWFLAVSFWAAVVNAGPSIQTWQTHNGAAVYFVPAPELPMFDLQVTFDAGSARDAEQAGLARLTNALLAEGADGLSAEALSDGFSDLGANLSSEAARDSASVGLRSLTDPQSMSAALELFARVLTRPDFPEQAVTRMRQIMRVTLEERAQSPDGVAEDAFYSAIYGGHPYASPPGGTDASLEALGREDVQRFYRRFYTARNAVVALVGALDRGQAERIAEQVMDGLPEGEAAPTLPAVPALVAPRFQDVSFHSQQSHILMGQPGVMRGDPDFFPLYVGNHALGGGALVSHLYEELRAKRGLSYQAYSQFIPLRQLGPFMASLQTRNGEVGEALQVLRAALDRYVTDGPDEQELDDAKRNLAGGFPLRLGSNAALVAYLATIGFYRLPLDYLDTWVARVEAVTRAEVRDAFHRRLAPANMVTVIVGGGSTAAVATDPH